MAKFRAFSCKEELDSSENHDYHQHSLHQVLFISRGVSILSDKQRKRPVFGNSIAFIPAGTEHRSSVVGKSLTFQILFFSKNISPHFKPEIVVFEMSDLGIALFNKLCSQDFKELTRGLKGECLKLFLKILALDLKNEPRSVKLPIPSAETNSQIVDFIQKHYREKITLAEIAKTVSYSARHLNRLFRDDLLITVYEYLRLYRIFMASIMLSKDKMKITDIAYDCGYESLSVFYRDFNKYFGVTPKAFRQKATPIQ
jgi:AraC-like DNA-binding protein